MTLKQFFSCMALDVDETAYARVHTNNGWMKEVSLEDEGNHSDINELLTECGNEQIASFYHRMVREDDEHYDVYFIFLK